MISETNPPGFKKFISLDGSTFLAPTNANFAAVYKTGQSLSFKYNVLEIESNVGHYGRFDFQRNKGAGYKRNTIFYRAYTDASNYAVGVYMNGATFTLEETLKIASGFARKRSSNAGDPRQKEWQTRVRHGVRIADCHALSHLPFAFLGFTKRAEGTSLGR